MWLLHKNYAVTTKLSNPASRTLRMCWSVLGLKFVRSKVSVHHSNTTIINITIIVIIIIVIIYLTEDDSNVS